MAGGVHINFVAPAGIRESAGKLPDRSGAAGNYVYATCPCPWFLKFVKQLFHLVTFEPSELKSGLKKPFWSFLNVESESAVTKLFSIQEEALRKRQYFLVWRWQFQVCPLLQPLFSFDFHYISVELFGIWRWLVHNEVVCQWKSIVWNQAKVVVLILFGKMFVTICLLKYVGTLKCSLCLHSVHQWHAGLSKSSFLCFNSQWTVLCVCIFPAISLLLASSAACLSYCGYVMFFQYIPCLELIHCFKVAHGFIFQLLGDSRT